MKIVCLTGGLASGKSTASMFLEDHGAVIIDADKLGHRAYDQGSQAYRSVIDTFGEEVVGEDGEIDRKVLGGKVFGNPEELKKLTDIVWPEIRRLTELEISGYEAMDPDGVVVLEAAVLFEAGWEDLGDEIWVVVVEREVAISRAMSRDGLDREAVENRLNSQLSNEERSSRATLVLDNSESEQTMQAQIDKEWARLAG
ncbi:MAG TPA: dephospho-CoA kinase [Pseudomonadales bacterium]|nr:dephospho-CoA kinase [Pseudomonadales bacterium]MDP6316850.1 dephospho-CoA kinase [Pseudomonadales bacterium]MDP7315959.1 dephospho-CoA kinase [Pseudomonadales bacterium]HJL60495.1 dephospho-CoA kinase [Pseudomonadales bacterium]HJP49997.1 dephospho-CoA kinase [Pseudomonadales bacterium]